MATARRVRIVVNSLERFVDELIKKIVLDITANLKRAAAEGGTPVDTGWARANWIPNIGRPREGTAGSPESVSQSDQAAGEGAVAATYTTAKGPVHITNNVPYITFLNAGSSPQAQPGFVQRAIMKAVREDLAGAFRSP